MAENSKIEWTDHTFNPWRGCTKASPACQHCYADAQAKRNPAVLGVWGDHGTRVVASETQWQLPLKWNREASADGVRRRVFCASMADVFEEWDGPMLDSAGRVLVSSPLYGSRPGDPLTMDDVRLRLFALIETTPNLDWLLLTKRPENFSKTMPRITKFRPNVWLGTTVEDQQRADERIPLLLQVPAAVRFLSVEPMLGPVDLPRWLPAGNANWQCQKCKSFQRYYVDCQHCGAVKEYLSGSHVANKRWPVMGGISGWINRQPIDWVICGGESGHGARPMHPDWARSLRNQCQAAGVPFFFKQWGEWMPWTADDLHRFACPPDRAANRIWEDWSVSVKVGKKAAGRLLDGREWNDHPKVVSV